MAADSEVQFEIGHVLFIDLVGYSQLLLDEQKRQLRELTEIVLAAPQVLRASNEQQALGSLQMDRSDLVAALLRTCRYLERARDAARP